MVARLWWKEARMFWPIWVFLVVVAVATQMLRCIHLRSARRSRPAFWPFLALGWTCFYALRGERRPASPASARTGRSNCSMRCPSSAGGSGRRKPRSRL